MENRISEFALANRVIDIFCHRFEAEYVDVPVIFDEGPTRHENGVFYLSADGSLTKTLFSIVFLYLRYYVPDAPPEAKQNVLRFFLALARDFEQSDSQHRFDASGVEETVAMRLDQNAFVWTMMKDIICPLKGLTLKNIRVIAGKTARVDACRYIKRDDVKTTSLPDEIFPFIFMNLYVDSFAIRSAFLLVEAMRAHLSDTHLGQPEDVLREIFSNYFIKDKLIAFVKMVFVDEEQEANFFAVLSILCNSEDLERLAVREEREKSHKEAQMMGAGTGNWWFLGLTEKMLEPARTEDWTVYETWKPVTEELWAKVESERRKRGLDEVPFEMLLRIQSEDFKTDETKTLQALLSDNRIW
jgi:hypothetical protein